jgi:glycosyltransferase involved in cell wall biosynthesis
MHVPPIRRFREVSGKPMRVLFVHRQGPGQFVHLARHLAATGHAVTLLCQTPTEKLSGVRVMRHRAVEANDHDGTAVGYQLRMGEETGRVMDRLRQAEGAPDIIIGHGGWGNLLFAKDVFPQTPLLTYCEFFYQPRGADVGFDPKTPTRLADFARLKARNFAQLSLLTQMEAGWSPTRWQKSLFPQGAQRRIGVVHDGIDLAFCRPDDKASLVLPNGQTARAGDPVITYAARNLEPYRGFPQFLRAAATLARKDPRVTFLVAGSPEPGYGPGPEGGGTWRDRLMAETGLDPARIHFLGTLPHADLIRLFQVSAAHVYLSYPFVLSWSLLEAMAAGCLVIGSNTAPVSEFVEPGRNGLLVPFFDESALVAAMTDALAHGPRLAPLRAAARHTVSTRAALDQCLRTQTRGLAQLLDRRALTA